MSLESLHNYFGIKVKILKKYKKYVFSTFDYDPETPSLTPSKVLVSTARLHVRTARQPDRQTDGQIDRRKFFSLVLCSKTNET